MDEKWKCYMQSMKGKHHKDRNMLCQDRVAYKEKGSLQSIVLVDGIGDTDINIVAGEKITEYTNDFLLTYFELIMKEKEDNIKEKLLRGIRQIIKNLSREFQISEMEFSSTLLAVCIDGKASKYCAIHLGDGIILKKTNRIDVLSYPVNGLCPNQTFLTTSQLAFSKMKLFRGDVGCISEFVLLSDGVDNILYDYYQLGDTFECIKANKSVLTEQEDDQSIIILGRN